MVQRNVKRISGALLLAIAIGAAGFGAGQATAAQPAMNTALDHLKAARNALQRATSDKGGHRERAIALTNDAIDETEKGIRFDRRH